jgi:hypothetical protein
MEYNDIMEYKMNKNGKLIGALSGFYLALSYLVGIIIFLVILKYPEITNSIDKVKALHDYKFTTFFTNVLMYILFGPVFIAFIISLKSRFCEYKSALFDFSAIIGYIWAGCLVASGMVANAGIEPVLAIYNNDIERASKLWEIIDTISMGLGNGNGEILGGIFTLSFSIFALKNELLNKIINIFGIIIGFIGIVSLLPMLNDFGGIFGITQMIWFICIGISFIKK